MRFYTHEDSNCTTSQENVTRMISCAHVFEFDAPDYDCYQGDGEISTIEDSLPLSVYEFPVIAEQLWVEEGTKFYFKQFTISCLSNSEIEAITLNILND